MPINFACCRAYPVEPAPDPLARTVLHLNLRLSATWYGHVPCDGPCQQGLNMNKYSWLVALAPLVVMACSNGIVGKGEQLISSDAGNGQQQPLADSGQQLALP